MWRADWITQEKQKLCRTGQTRAMDEKGGGRCWGQVVPWPIINIYLKMNENSFIIFQDISWQLDTGCVMTSPLGRSKWYVVRIIKHSFPSLLIDRTWMTSCALLRANSSAYTVNTLQEHKMHKLLFLTWRNVSSWIGFFFNWYFFFPKLESRTLFSSFFVNFSNLCFWIFCANTFCRFNFFFFFSEMFQR